MAGTRVADISPDLVEAVVDELFNAAMQSERRMYYANCVREVTVNKRTGTYLTLGALRPAAERFEADNYDFQRVRQGNKTQLTATTRGIAVEASMETLEDDLYGYVDNSFGEPMVDRMHQLRERLVADAYNGVFSNTGADGVAICADSHPLLETALFVNDNLASGEINATNLKNAKLMFNWIYDQAGEYYETAPTDLIVHPQKTYYLIELLESNLLAHELSNNTNSIQSYLPSRIVPNKYLSYITSTGVSPWHLIDKNIKAGCVLQWRKKLSLKTWWENNNDVFRGTARERYAVGFVAPGYGIISSPGT